MAYFKDTIQKQYRRPGALIESRIDPIATLKSLVQTASESLLDYYTRALEVFRICAVVQGPDTSASEEFVRILALTQYVDGIHSSELRYKSMEMGVGEAKDIFEAFKIIQRAQSLLDNLKKEKQDEVLCSLMAQATLNTSAPHRSGRSYQQHQAHSVPQSAPQSAPSVPQAAPAIQNHTQPYPQPQPSVQP